jgi:hypothetical protein
MCDSLFLLLLIIKKNLRTYQILIGFVNFILNQQFLVHYNPGLEQLCG